MNFKYGYDLGPEAAKEYLRGGCFLTEEEGLWVTYETKPELIRAALPPCLEYVNPYITIYLVRIGRTSFCPAFMETAVTLLASYNGEIGMYSPGMLLDGPGAEAATSMGREIYGIPKKFADLVEITKVGSSVHARIERHGKKILDANCALGAYNDHELGMQTMGMPKKGENGGGSAWFFTYDAHQDPETMDTVFDAVHLNDTVSKVTQLEDWIPGRIDSLVMEDSVNDPWSYFTVKKLIGCGYGHQELHMVKQNPHRNVGSPEANLAKMIHGKFDMPAFGDSTRILNAKINK